MSNSTVNRVVAPYGKGGRSVTLPVDGGSHIYAGTLVAQLGTAMLVPGSTSLAGPAIGVAEHECDNTSGADGDLRCKVRYGEVFCFPNGTSTDACSEATTMFAPVYMGDDHTIYDNDGASTLKPAGRFMGMEPDGKVRVFVGMANLADAFEDASGIALADTGAFTAATDVEAAVAEIYQDIKSIQKTVDIPLTSFLDPDGDPLAKFVNGSVDGYSLNSSEAMGLRWNNAGSPTVFLTCVAMPQDYDDTAAVVMHFLASKVGATATDTPAFVVTAFSVSVGSVYTTSTDFGGTSTVSVDNTLVQELTLSLASGSVPASPTAFTLTIVPNDLATDDYILHAVWLEYKGKLLTS